MDTRMTCKNYQHLHNKALHLLSLREHSRHELKHKLKATELNTDYLEQVLDELTHQGYLCDSRFTDVYCRSRAYRGYGPVRISQELKQKGIDEQTIRLGLLECEVDWYENAHQVFAKKFALSPAKNLKEKAKQQQFLLYRGFTFEQIKCVFEHKQE